MRVVFLGTEELGETVLRKLAESRHDVMLVITPPDRPKGRGRTVVPGLVVLACEAYGIPILQPETVRDEEAVTAINAVQPDILTVVSYGEFIPSKIYKKPPHGAVNVHPSLLPRWRGASPVRYTLLNGDKTAGVTVQYLAKKMDAGDVLMQEEIPVDPLDNHGTLCEKLYPLGADLLVRVLDAIEAGDINPVTQDESEITFAPKIEKSDLWIDWTEPAEKVRDRIRAFAPDPGARATFRDGQYKILDAEPDFVGLETEPAPGIVMNLTKSGPVIACGDHGLKLTMLQPPGKKPVRGVDFQNGYRLAEGDEFTGQPV